MQWSWFFFHYYQSQGRGGCLHSIPLLSHTVLLLIHSKEILVPQTYLSNNVLCAGDRKATNTAEPSYQFSPWVGTRQQCASSQCANVMLKVKAMCIGVKKKKYQTWALEEIVNTLNFKSWKRSRTEVAEPKKKYSEVKTRCTKKQSGRGLNASERCNSPCGQREDVL